jgi:hypothetical protein
MRARALRAMLELTRGAAYLSGFGETWRASRFTNRRQVWCCGRGHLKIPREPVDVLEKNAEFFSFRVNIYGG